MIDWDCISKEELMEHLLIHPPIPVFGESKNWSNASGVRQHTHQDLYQFDYFHGGKGDYEVNGRRYVMDESLFFFMCPGDNHSIAVPAAENTRGYGVKFKLAPLIKDKKSQFIRFNNAFLLDPNRRAALVEVLRKAVGYTVIGDEESKIRASNALREMLVRLIHWKTEGELQMPPETEAKDEIVSRVLSHLQANLDRWVSLTELGRHVGMSRFHLARSFSRKTGRTPHQSLLEMKLERSRTLLTDTDSSVAEIAKRVGFRKPAYFSLLFKRKFGATPRDMRKKARECG